MRSARVGRIVGNSKPLGGGCIEASLGVLSRLQPGLQDRLKPAETRLWRYRSPPAQAGGKSRSAEADPDGCPECAIEDGVAG